VDRETVEKLEKADWDRIIPELARFALKRVQRLSWKQERIPKGLNADGIACEAIALVFDGDRRWDPEKDPDLMGYLRSVVNSLISHLYELKDYKISERFREYEDGGEQVPVPEGADGPVDLINDPEKMLIEQEEARLGEELYDDLLDFLKDDDELGEVVLCIREDAVKPREIARLLGVEAEEIYSRKKRLQRRYDEFENMRKGVIINGGEMEKRRRAIEEPREPF
jgi:DNA-directed RNA polymerase specialized sigma24 family protein